MRNVFAAIVMIALLASCAPVMQTVAPAVSSPPTVTRLLPSATLLPSTETLVPVTFTLTPTYTLIPALATRTPVPTATPIPFPSKTSTPTPGPSPTPSVPTVFSPDGEAVRGYKGPAVEYISTCTFSQAEIVGKDETGKWWYVKVDEGGGRYTFCWVADKNVNAGGNLKSVLVTEPGLANVTAVNISLTGDYTQTVLCEKKTDKPVFHFTGEIVTDGPVKNVKYLWETNAGQKFSQKQVQIRAWDDPAEFKLDISVPAQAGTYSLTLRTIYPNEIVWVVQFVVKCQ